MNLQFQSELDILKTKLIDLGERCQAAVDSSITALLNKDKNLASKVIKDDLAIDKEEVKFEEECMKVIALHQPVAVDLRVLIAFIKINNDLERVGDLAVSIARKAKFLAKKENKAEIDIDFEQMANRSRKVLSLAIKSIIDYDTSKARSALRKDEKVNKLKRKYRDEIIKKMKNDKSSIEPLIRVHSAIRSLERVADMGTNIAEDVIYISTGRIVRHGMDQDYMED